MIERQHAVSRDARKRRAWRRGRECAAREAVRRTQRIQPESRQRKRVPRDRQRGTENGALESRPIVDERLHQTAIGVRVGTEAARGLVEGRHDRPGCAIVQWMREHHGRCNPAQAERIERQIAKGGRGHRKRMNGRAHVVHEARPCQLGGSHAAADRRLGFEHEHAPAGPRDRDRGGQAVRPRPHHNRIETVGHVLATLQYLSADAWSLLV